MAGHLEKIFEKWQSHQDEPEEYVWLQSTKNTVEMLFKGFEVNIVFPLDLADIRSYRFVTKEKSCESWVTSLNAEIPSAPNLDAFNNLLDLSVKCYKNRNNSNGSTTTTTTTTTSKSDTNAEVEMSSDNEGEDIDDDDGEDEIEEEEDDDAFENDHFQEALQTLKMKKIWAKKDQEIRAQLGERKKKDPKVNSIFSSDAAFGVLTNDLFSIMQNVHSLGFSAQPIDDNIYFWSVKMFGFHPDSNICKQLQLVKKEFEYDYVELQVLFTEDLYPFYPPTLKIIRPRLQGFLIGKFAQLDVNNPLNSLANSGSYSSIEHFLLRLEVLRANLKYGLAPNIVKPANVITKPKAATGDKQLWAKGTGYGRGSQNGWNVEAFIAAQKERDTETITLINAIEKELKIKPPPFDVIEESCLLPFFESYYTIASQENYIPLFSHLSFQTKSLGTLLATAASQIELVFKVLDESQKKSLVPQNLILSVNTKIQGKLKSMMDELKKLEVMRGPVEQVDSTVEIKYVNMLQPHLFDVANLNAAKASGSTVQSRILRIAQEQGGLVTSLPITFDSTVFVRVDERNIDTMQALITGPADTPYSAGCFLFTITFPANYPSAPPSVILSTTGEGSVRFNPNLYNNGKVCLSLLGTWSGGAGETWNGNTSTLLQVLVSIQSLILVPEPFFNEPGYESQIGSPQGKVSSSSYNQNIRIATIEWAMIDMIKKPPPAFKDIIHAHFWFQKQKIKAQCDKWLEECKSNNDSYFKLVKVVNTLNTELQALKEPKL
eukprot:gene3595-4118_t